MMKQGILEKRNDLLNLYGVLSILVMSLLLMSAMAFGAQEMTGQSISDAVSDELLYDQAVLSTNINVQTTDGIVTLTGEVDNILAKERAARIAEVVKGVRSVINRINVEPEEKRSDTELKNRISNALLEDPAADSFEISVSVDDGIATLSGNVDSWQEKELAAKVAKGVDGLKELNNEIDVVYKTERSDPEIKAEIEQKLRWDVLVDDALIDVSVDEGNVMLSGTVGSAAEKSQATQDAWVAGVDSVENDNLAVMKWARDKELRKDKYKAKSDTKIKQAIEDALLYDPRVLSFNIDPEVSARVVTLRGEVDNLKAKRAASSLARNTVGVLDVVNRIKVRPEAERDSGKVASDIRESLLNDPYIDRYEITVSVNNGTVHLYGDVDSYFEKSQADDVASRVKGVQVVKNHLTVSEEYDPYIYDPYVDDWYVYDYDWYRYEPTYPMASDTQIRQDINSEIWWSPFVDADEVEVSVNNGVATLSGSVDSWSERNAARENAFEGGASWVVNNIDVE
jgi:osmotically-inducible protein OsmY